jgi:hypothetical protein
MKAAIIVTMLVLWFFVPAAAADTSCAVVGDSIAADLALHMQACLSDALGGIPSTNVIGRVHPADVLFVSVGSNDPNNPRLEDNLEAIRAKASARVVWILPMILPAALAVERVAARHNDPIMPFEPGPDGKHPKSYETFAAALRAFLK